QDSGVDPEWTPSGMLLLEPGDTEAALAWATRWGAPVEMLPGKDILQQEPALGRAPAEAIWMPAVAQVRNPRLVRALRGSLERHGVQVREGASVTGLIFQGDRVLGVASAAGPLHGGSVVIAGGAWSAGLLGEVARLEVAPVR